MKFELRDDGWVWMDSGLCPFYYHRNMPKCVITRLSLTARDVFTDDGERQEISSHDCLGMIPGSCPWVASLWAASSGGDPSGSTPSEPIVDVDGIQVEFLDFVPDPFDACDAVMLPTTRMGRFDLLGQRTGWSAETESAVLAEMSMFELPLDEDRAVVTRLPGTGYSFAIHVPIFDDAFLGGTSMAAFDHAAELASDAGVRSLEVRPMCIVVPSGTVPAFNVATEAVLSSIRMLRRDGRLSSLSFIRILAPAA